MVTNYELQVQNHARTMNIEDGFRGMKYTDAPLDNGFCQAIVNFDISNDNTSLKVRPGFVKSETISQWTQNSGEESFIHHVGRISVQDYQDDMTTTLCRYAVVGQSYTADATEEVHGLPGRTFDVNTMKLIIEYKGNFLTGTYSGTSRSGLYMPLVPTVSEIHGMSVACGSREGVFAQYDGNTYIPVYQSTTNTETNVTTFPSTLRYIKCMFNANKTGFTWQLVSVAPKEITATSAVNSGYNMLKDNPFAFDITQTTGNALVLDGIIPYDNNGNLITTCKPGDLVKFKLAYRYPSSHASKHYAVAWDITDNNSENAETVSLQPLRKNKTTMYQDVTVGGEISISTNQTSYTSFTLTCYVYDRDVVREIDYTSDALDSVNCSPLATMTVSFTYLSSDATTTSNLGANNYNLCTAKGMCTWQNRIVLWGVNGASSAIFISDINDPSYFPYPNNIELFDSQVVKAMPFKDSLLVFTEDTLYQITYDGVEAVFKTVAIQQGLKTEIGEASSIMAIQNMLFFKNGNQYYMLVPGKYASNQYGELMLAPISDAIEEIFDNFSDFLSKLTGYGIPTVVDWNCYLEHNTFRIVYKVKPSTVNVYQDVIFMYNVKSRSWTVYMHRACRNRMIQWIQSSTLDSTFIVPVGTDTNVALWTVESDRSVTTDNLPWFNDGPEHIQCMLNTGFRNIDLMHKKKFRQVQFYLETQGAEYTIFPEVIVDNNMVFNIDNSYVEDDTMYCEMLEFESVHDKVSRTDRPTDYEYYHAERVCIPFCAKGHTASVNLYFEFSGDGFRPELRSFTWVYRTQSGRGGRDGDNT